MEKYEFQPKEWVLVRDLDEQKWKLDIFSHYIEGSMYPYRCVSANYVQCIPYEGSEALLGTKDEPKEKKTGEWKVGDKVEVEYDTDKKWYGGEIVRIDFSNRSWVDSEVMPYYVRSECFKYNDGCAWCAARQLREPVEKNADEDWNVGDIVEVKNERDGCWYPGKILFIKKGAMPYFVQSEFGFKDVSKLTRCSFCSKDQLRNLGETPEPKEEEEFKFGDRVEVSISGKWVDAIFLYNDESDSAPYKIASKMFGDIYWVEKKDVRRA